MFLDEKIYNKIRKLKNEIISEYLCNKIDDDLFNLGNSKDGEDFGEKQQINSNKKCEEDVLLKNILYQEE